MTEKEKLIAEIYILDYEGYISQYHKDLRDLEVPELEIIVLRASFERRRDQELRQARQWKLLISELQSSSLGKANQALINASDTDTPANVKNLASLINIAADTFIEMSDENRRNLMFDINL